MTDKAILSAANVLLTTYNNDNMSVDKKAKIFSTITDMCITAEDCLSRSRTEDYHKEKILDVIEEANSVLD